MWRLSGLIVRDLGRQADLQRRATQSREKMARREMARKGARVLAAQADNSLLIIQAAGLILALLAALLLINP